MRPGPIGIQTGESEVMYRGDAEAGLAVTIADRWDVGTRKGGFRAAAEGLVRFPTGVRARTDRAFAIGTGDGQTDVEVRGTVDLGSGNLGVRLEGGYNRQLAGDIAARVAPPSQAFPARSLLTNVRLDPGDVTTLAVRPFFRLARSLGPDRRPRALVQGCGRGDVRERPGRHPRRGAPPYSRSIPMPALRW